MIGFLAAMCDNLIRIPLKLSYYEQSFVKAERVSSDLYNVSFGTRKSFIASQILARPFNLRLSARPYF